ncbi:MAG TPA: hypothetical protein IAA59_00765 [Candidatus Faecaligallichristensenella faecipullorum]|nr:hypothetical protein [Candidatus Faecaligallichristensenella faecipullorum]
MKYIRRFMWFLSSRLVIFTLVVGILVLVFYTCLNISNIYILLSDGMKARAQVMLTREDPEQLNNYFRAEFLTGDEALNLALGPSSPYVDYEITDFEYKLSIESVWCWPWQDTASATIVERIPKITGKVVSSRSEAVEDGSLPSTPPTWQGGRYEITLYRSNGQWKVAGMRQTQIIVEPTPSPTPEPTAAPSPAAEG